jgi:hypothetical protein
MVFMSSCAFPSCPEVSSCAEASGVVSRTIGSSSEVVTFGWGVGEGSVCVLREVDGLSLWPLGMAIGDLKWFGWRVGGGVTEVLALRRRLGLLITGSGRWPLARVDERLGSGVDGRLGPSLCSEPEPMHFLPMVGLKVGVEPSSKCVRLRPKLAAMFVR